MAEQEIGEIVSEDHSRRCSDELKASSFTCVLENPMKTLHKYHLMCSPLAIITCITFNVVLGSAGIKMGTILLFVMARLFAMLLLRHTSADLQTYSRTVAVVADDYALLVMINMEYIEIAIGPAILLLFIGALASKARRNLQRHRSQLRDQRREEPVSLLMKTALMPYLLQLFFVIWTQYRGHQDNSIFTFSDFLIFFSSVLCAVAVMIHSPPIGATPVLQQDMAKACIVVLMITAQTMAAEWVGKDIMFVCMPKLIAVLLWLWSRFHDDGHLAVAMCSVTMGRPAYFLSSVVGVVALLLSIYPNNDIGTQAAWLVRLLCISTSCSALSHFHAWLLHQWPGRVPPPDHSDGLIQLLRFSSAVTKQTSVILFFAMMITMMVSLDPWIFQHQTTETAIAVALVLFPLLLSHADGQTRNPKFDVQREFTWKPKKITWRRRFWKWWQRRQPGARERSRFAPGQDVVATVIKVVHTPPHCREIL